MRICGEKGAAGSLDRRTPAQYAGVGEATQKGGANPYLFGAKPAQQIFPVSPTQQSNHDRLFQKETIPCVRMIDSCPS